MQHITEKATEITDLIEMTCKFENAFKLSLIYPSKKNTNEAQININVTGPIIVLIM